eukprot:130312-Chlamydomonas_euryale.AAC.1
MWTGGRAGVRFFAHLVNQMWTGWTRGSVGVRRRAGRAGARAYGRAGARGRGRTGARAWLLPRGPRPAETGLCVMVVVAVVVVVVDMFINHVQIHE